MALGIYAGWYYYRETKDIIDTIELQDRVAEWLDHTKIGAYMPLWVPTEAVSTHNELTMLRVHDSRKTSAKWWIFIIVDKHLKIRAIVGTRIRY